MFRTDEHASAAARSAAMIYHALAVHFISLDSVWLLWIMWKSRKFTVSPSSARLYGHVIFLAQLAVFAEKKFRTISLKPSKMAALITKCTH
jgi:hypothetical protein